MTIPYLCVRCGYSTDFKGNMRTHFMKKKPCPTALNNIELTDAIKNEILKSRIYHIPKNEMSVQQIINNNIQHNNTVNNYIIKMDTMEKLNHYVNFNKIETIGIEFDVEEKYKNEINKLEGDKYKYGFHLNNDKLLEIIDNISNVSDNLDDFNVLYDDANMNKI